MSEIAILINSCDKYSDAWKPFFQILEKSWPESKKYPIYLNTESLSYEDPYFNVRVLNCIGDKDKTPWGKRLNDALDRIDSDYVLFLLEDFFFEERIDQIEIEKCLDYIRKDKRIVTISMTSPQECMDKDYCRSHEIENMPGYVLRIKRADYKLNAGPALWRKSLLKKWTFNTDTPWGWEFFGSKRTWFSNDKFIGRSILAPEIFIYDIAHGGAIHRGKWVGYKMRELMEKYNISIDMSQREIEEDYLKENRKPLPIYKRLTSILTNRAKFFNSLVCGFFYR